MAPYVDLHSHVLPGLDDGAATIEAGLQMIGALAALGFSELHTTPHQRADLYLPDRAAIAAAFGRMRDEAGRRVPGVSLDVAAESFWDGVFYERVRSGSVPAYAGDKAFLFELDPQAMPPTLGDELFRIRVRGRLPVMAHPERYAAVQANLGKARELGQRAALLVDLAALEGAHGRAAMRTARRLIDDGLAHAAASDIHRPEDAAAVEAGMRWLRRRHGQASLDRLLAENPRRILAGDLP